MKKCKAEVDVAIGGREEIAPVAPAARVYRREWGPCPNCGNVLSKTNVARHI